MTGRYPFLICAAIVLAGTVFAGAQDIAPQRGGGQAATLPEGAGKGILERSCTVCHGLIEVTKFKGYYTKEDWSDIVRTMVADGARLGDGETPVLVEYLAANFGKISLPEGEGRRILEASCATCHDLVKVTNLKLANPDWRQVVDRMGVLMKGRPEGPAPLSDAQVTTLVDYLTKNFGPAPRANAAPQ